MSNTREYFEQMYRRELKRAGTHFFCNACLVHKPLDERSLDKRYCHECYDFLMEEASLDTSRRRADWKPREARQKPIEEEEIAATPNTPCARSEEVLLRTNLGNAHEYQNPTQTPIIDLGGRPRKDIPIDLIHNLSKQGLGVREIVRELKEYSLSPMSISRVLSGQRTS